MKVTGGGKPTPTGKIGRAASSRADTKRATAPSDTASIAGIPEAELTPRVRAALTQLMEEVASLRQDLKEAKSQLKELSALANTDPLLGVLNRRAFVAELNRTYALVDRYDLPAALAFFDVDKMKSINDAYGHAGGDKALVHIANVLSENTRQTDILARLGGDEFGLIFNHTELEDAQAKTTALCSQIAETPIEIDNMEVTVSVTGGVTKIDRASSAASAIDEADRKMYAGKKGASIRRE
jgi:diguanylate cyclase (GGDEF)-like protein